MKNKKIISLLAAGMLLLTSCGGQGAGGNGAAGNQGPIVSGNVSFLNASVHDPSVIKVKDTYYVFGSHLAAAKTTDLMNWEQISSIVSDGNPLIPDVYEELEETFEWAQSDTLWAADVIQLKDGKYYMYYNACRGDSPLSAMGVAVSKKIEGPYKDKGIILKSGMAGESDDGTPYDATEHPNVVDPDVFFDKDGKLWMVYGSYSGGIYIMEMDPKTGMPYPDQGYGKKLLGANHSRIEGPYMMYSPETDYYYLFLSFGGLDAIGGYNIRVMRSENPDGPFVDAEDNDMTVVGGPKGTFFDDEAIAPYGVKLMGNVQFTNVDGETAGFGTSYVSPGHNSAYYDEKTGKYFLIFHTRFPGKGEMHEVRVHQMFMNEDGWPVVAPNRYTGEKIGSYDKAELTGDYKFVRHGKDITAEIKESSLIHFAEDDTVSGSETGTWSLDGDHGLKLTIDGMEFKGVFLRQWDEGTQQSVINFTGISDSGEAVWGSHTALAD